MLMKSIGILIVGMNLVGCLTPAAKRQMTNDIYTIQTRLLQVETHLKDRDKNFRAADAISKKLSASTSTNLEKINFELQKMKGEMEALRIGVATGQLPGASEEGEGSIALTLSKLGERLENVEEVQGDILSTLEKLGKGIKPSSKKPRTSLSSISALRSAFERKRYKHVAEDAQRLLKKIKGKKKKEEVVFLYAESLYKLGRLRDSALKYNDLLDMKPSQKRIPHAKLRMGDSFRHLGDKATARLYYEELVQQYPKAPEARMARERLGKL